MAVAEAFEFDDFVVGEVGQLVECAHPLVDAGPVVAVDHTADFLQVGHGALLDDSHRSVSLRSSGVRTADASPVKRGARAPTNGTLAVSLP